MLLAHLTSPDWATIIIGFMAGALTGLVTGLAIARRGNERS